jgi:hypothetical protein
LEAEEWMACTNFSRTQHGSDGIITGKAGFWDGEKAIWEISVSMRISRTKNFYPVMNFGEQVILTQDYGNKNR